MTLPSRLEQYHVNHESTTNNNAVERGGTATRFVVFGANRSCSRKYTEESKTKPTGGSRRGRGIRTLTSLTLSDRRSSEVTAVAGRDIRHHSRRTGVDNMPGSGYIKSEKTTGTRGLNVMRHTSRMQHRGEIERHEPS